MRESEEKLEATSDQKSRIRERYKGIDEDQLDVIPAIPTEDFYKPNSIKRVAVYARVSTDDPRQTSSYELQKNHYTDLVNRREDWKLVDIYADEGISGTSLKHRDSFIRMIADCKAGKIDLIVTKSVSRFARNVLDCIGYVRQLAAMSPPIGVFFETENIYTLNPNSEMSLSFISTLAQEESHNKSEIMNASIEMRFKRGIFLTPVLLGYDQDSDGNLIVNEDEAKIVRLIFLCICTVTHVPTSPKHWKSWSVKQSEAISPGQRAQCFRFYRMSGIAEMSWQGKHGLRTTWITSRRKTIMTGISIVRKIIMRPLFQEMISLQFRG